MLIVKQQVFSRRNVVKKRLHTDLEKQRKAHEAVGGAAEDITTCHRTEFVRVSTSLRPPHTWARPVIKPEPLSSSHPLLSPQPTLASPRSLGLGSHHRSESQGTHSPVRDVDELDLVDAMAELAGAYATPQPLEDGGLTLGLSQGDLFGSQSPLRTPTFAPTEQFPEGSLDGQRMHMQQLCEALPLTDEVCRGVV